MMPSKHNSEFRVTRLWNNYQHSPPALRVKVPRKLIQHYRVSKSARFYQFLADIDREDSGQASQAQEN
jgi:hypothetical protein